LPSSSTSLGGSSSWRSRWGLLALLVSRILWRRWLSLHRSRGLLSSRVLLVGSGETAAHIAAELRRHSDAGYHVVGVLVTDRRESILGLSGLPAFSSVEDLLRAVSECRADTVFITDGHNLPPARLRELSWSLEPGRQHLVMAPSLTDIAGPRIHARPSPACRSFTSRRPAMRGRTASSSGPLTSWSR
jgi:FlaA1/EpsC-like NDP-sugar epimerase